MIEENSAHVLAIRTCTDSAQVAPRDVVILATKAQDLRGALDTAAPLIAASSVVIPAVNGVPWWYFKGAADAQARPIEAVDPGGVLWSRLKAENIVGAVVHWGATVESPGPVRQTTAPRLILGELDGKMSDRAEAIADPSHVADCPSKSMPAFAMRCG